MHYRRWQRHGDPLRVKSRDEWERVSAEDRFWSKVDKSAGACWKWTGYVNADRYGLFKMNGKMKYAHRAAWTFVGRPLTDGLELHHKCGNPSCVNPEHLTEMTHAEHLRNTGWSNHNARKTHCKRGHEFTSENTYVPPSGKRQCRTCLRDYAREWQRNRRSKQ